MKRMKTYTVACLSRRRHRPRADGRGEPRARRGGRLHGFRVDEVHPPFAGEAVSRYGHPLPLDTRAACRTADAVLVALDAGAGARGREGRARPHWRVQRVPAGRTATSPIVSPLDDELEPFVVRARIRPRPLPPRAVDRRRRRRRRGRTSSTGRPSGIPASSVERAVAGEALPRLMNAPERLLRRRHPAAHAELVSDLAAAAGTARRIVASGRLSHDGPGVFGPTHGSAPDIAGQGVANPSGMLLAASLMLGEGLGERRGRGDARAGGVVRAGPGVRTPTSTARAGASTTRDFTDAVLELMPSRRAPT